MLDWLDPQTKALLKDAALGQVRHGMTYIAGALGSYGLFATNDQQLQFVSIGTAVVVGASAQLWSWWQKTGKGQMQARMVDLAAKAELKRQQAAAAHVTAAAQEEKAKALLAEAQKAPPLAPAAP
jgi:hypothetical protein